MFVLKAEKNRLTVLERELVTSGSVEAYTVRFQFSRDWDGLSRAACFRAGAQTVSVLLDSGGECTVPWEVMGPDGKGKTLYAGVCGTKEGGVVLPTVWAGLGVILEGASGGENARAPTAQLWRQELGQKQDRLAGRPGQLVGFDGAGRAVAVDGAAAPTGAETATQEETNEMLDEVFGFAGE